MYFLCQIFRIHKLICSPFSWVLSGEKIYRYMVNQTFELKFHCRMYLFYMDVSENKRFSSSFSASSRKIFFYDLKFCFFPTESVDDNLFQFCIQLHYKVRTTEYWLTMGQRMYLFVFIKKNNSVLFFKNYMQYS